MSLVCRTCGVPLLTRDRRVRYCHLDAMNGWARRMAEYQRRREASLAAERQARMDAVTESRRVMLARLDEALMRVRHSDPYYLPNLRSAYYKIEHFADAERSDEDYELAFLIEEQRREMAYGDRAHAARWIVHVDALPADIVPSFDDPDDEWLIAAGRRTRSKTPHQSGAKQ